MDERTPGEWLSDGAPGDHDRVSEDSDADRDAAVSEAEPPVSPRPLSASGTHAGPTTSGNPPSWTAFLTPLAVIAGAVIIAGSILYSSGGRSGYASGAADAAAAPTASATVSASAPAGACETPGATPSPTPTPLARTAFESYAANLALDVTTFRGCVADTATAARVSAEQQAGLTLGVSGTPTFLINNKLLVGAMPWDVLNEVIQAELKDSPTTLDAYSDTIGQLAANDPPYFQILEAAPSVQGAALQGSTTAKVRIVEFSDFQCPYCKRWVDETYESLKPLLGDDISLTFVNFPLTQIHANATGAAIAAECAAAQDRFWEMHDLLFANQSAWSELSPD